MALHRLPPASKAADLLAENGRSQARHVSAAPSVAAHFAARPSPALRRKIAAHPSPKQHANATVVHQCGGTIHMQILRPVLEVLAPDRTRRKQPTVMREFDLAGFAGESPAVAADRPPTHQPDTGPRAQGNRRP